MRRGYRCIGCRECRDVGGIRDVGGFRHVGDVGAYRGVVGEGVVGVLQSIYSVFTVYLLSIYCLFTVYLLSIYCLFTVYLLSIYCLFTVYLLYTLKQ